MQENINIPDSTITTNLSFRQLVLMNMQQLTNFPYIEKDFDALTDYELLCLVVKFLNDVIANQNEQNASITRMYESFLALQDYVNNTKDKLEDAFNNLDDYVRNYFDNLDVQEEINNKLDQMLEDGVLTEIIQQFLQSTAIWCFDNVADMKQATNLINGSYTKTMGFYQVNDGGGSTYKIRTKTNSDVIDEMTIISLYDNNLIAELSCDSNIINIKQFGAYCDNTHDDSNALETCLNYVGTLSLSGGTWRRTILIPAIVKVTRRIDCTTDQFKMLGTSLNNSRIVFYGASSYMNFGDSSTHYHEIEIENVKFYGDYSQTQSIVKFTNCYNIYLTRVETCNGGENQYNISFINCGLMFLDRCTIVGSNDIVNYPGNRNGIYVNTDGSIFNFTNANCWNLNNVFKFGSMQNINIQNNWIECYKSLIEFDCVENMSYINLKLENNSLNTHKQSDAFYPTNLNFIKLNMADNTNLFGSNFSINNNTIYFWDVETINGNSLIYLTGIGASNASAWDINFNHNIFSGKRLNQLGAYVFTNSNQTFYNRYNVKFKSISTVVASDSQYITDNKAIISCILNEGQKGQVTAPNGIYVGNSGNENYGNIYYENGNFYGGYAGTIRQIPKRVGTAFPLVTQSTDLVSYLNDLTLALAQSGIIDRQS